MLTSRHLKIMRSLKRIENLLLLHTKQHADCVGEQMNAIEEVLFPDPVLPYDPDHYTIFKDEEEVFGPLKKRGYE